MRFYGKNFVQAYTDKRVRSFTETRDCLIWSVNKVNRTCEVRIQGTDTLVTAKFPQNLKQAPLWLRKGNAVQIMHRSGIRGSIYIMGQGTTSPTPMSGDAFPDPGLLPDAVLSGCQIYATDPNSMGVLITSGTYRIEGIVYNLTSELNSLLYGGTPEIFYGQEIEIFYGEDMILYLDTAPSVTYYRYDAFCVGIDGIIDYIKGTESQNPIKPDIPLDHILIDAYILVIGGISAISDIHIGMEWETPVTSYIEIDIEGEGIAYLMPLDIPGPQYVEADIVVSLFNQYGNPHVATYDIKLEFASGMGDLWSADSGYNDTEVTQNIYGSSYTFMYRREQLVDQGVVTFIASTKVGAITFELVGIIELEAE